MTYEEHKAAFLEATRGHTAYKVAVKVQANFTPGINWKGTAKKDMADYYARAKTSSHAVYPSMARVDLRKLKEMLT